MFSASGLEAAAPDFAQEVPSVAARQVADWVIDSKDNRGLPFLIVDKRNARSFVFDATGNIKGAASVLLGSATTDDNRISFGCINVPVDFYVNVVSPAFKKSGIAYVLPETRSLHETFAFDDVSEQARKPAHLHLYRR